MTNRKSRRTAAATMPELPAIPNVSGGDQSCANCWSGADTKVRIKIAHMHRLPAPPEDEIACLQNPGGGIVMKSWGWCSHWKPKVNG